MSVFLKTKDCDGDPMFYNISANFYCKYYDRLNALCGKSKDYELVLSGGVSDVPFDEDEILIHFSNFGV